MPHSTNLDKCETVQNVAASTLAFNGAARLNLLTLTGFQLATRRSFSTLVRRWHLILANSL